MESLEQRFAKYKQETNQRLNSIDAKFSVVNDTLQSIRSDFKELHVAVDNVYDIMGELLEQHRTDYQKLDKRISALEERQ
ncbi:hypothetical protein [Tunicatimonas pelagia]|uniref:hypothetical protein n=1 Tax=Tunicatimonas pelagia TaxID=931531 RepID=UPI0026668A68|nr:hypothetical protein [Tunicatimonas pelagia]WKN40791.1 hypothetical protein P0M28_17280 [Tunicatimonas pelagia]